MPNAAIEVGRPYSREKEGGIIKAVHAAMNEGLKIPEWDKTVRLSFTDPIGSPHPPA